MSKHSRFDRHELFEMSDTSFVMDCIQHVDRYDSINGGDQLCNMLYGLFDGYLYDTIYTYAYEHLPSDMYQNLERLCMRIQRHLSK